MTTAIAAEAEMGGRLLMKWDPSEALISAVTAHHDSQKAKASRFTTLIKLANCLPSTTQSLYEAKTEPRKDSRKSWR